MILPNVGIGNSQFLFLPPAPKVDRYLDKKNLYANACSVNPIFKKHWKVKKLSKKAIQPSKN